jgi:hypothetical protein
VGTHVQSSGVEVKGGLLNTNLTLVAGLAALPLLVVVALGSGMSAGRPGPNGPATCQTASPAGNPGPTRGDRASVPCF